MKLKRNLNNLNQEPNKGDKECIWIDPISKLPYKGWVTWDNGTISEIYSDTARDKNGKRFRVLVPLDEVKILDYLPRSGKIK